MLRDGNLSFRNHIILVNDSICIEDSGSLNAVDDDGNGKLMKNGSSGN